MMTVRDRNNHDDHDDHNDHDDHDDHDNHDSKLAVTAPLLVLRRPSSGAGREGAHVPTFTPSPTASIRSPKERAARIGWRTPSRKASTHPSVHRRRPARNMRLHTTATSSYGRLLLQQHDMMSMACVAWGGVGEVDAMRYGSVRSRAMRSGVTQQAKHVLRHIHVHEIRHTYQAAQP